MIRKGKILFIILFFCCTANVSAQQDVLGGSIHGNFELNAQYYLRDSAIGTPEVPEKVLSNGFANFIYEKDNFSAGIRYENYLNPMLGFDPRYKGSGIPYRYISYKNNELEVTVGSYYEQFGSGMIFRSYEERGLGLDNAMDGIRVKYNPHKGIYLKGVIGRQRDFFSVGDGIVRGGDGEWNINESFTKLASKKTKIILGGSFVSKFQDDQDPVFILPKNVGASAGRITVIHGGLTLNAEYVSKINDPSATNNFIYKDGSGTLFTAQYSKKGFGLNIGAKRIDNMSFRSDRTAVLNSLIINYLPAMTKNHTDILAAIYPYATQPNGEFAWQGEVFFNLKPDSKLGGKYGTDVSINYAQAQAIDMQPAGDDMGYTSDFFTPGKEVYFRDINVSVEHKWSKKVKTILSYMQIFYNKEVIEGRNPFDDITAGIAVAELNWKINSKNNFRTEIQHLSSEQDKQNWALVLVEYSFLPHWFIAGLDQYNYGNNIKAERFHYYTATMGYIRGANRIQIGYGRQRAGIFCVGGVCRNVPASNGFTLSITSSF